MKINYVVNYVCLNVNKCIWEYSIISSNEDREGYLLEYEEKLKIYGEYEVWNMV